MNKWNVISENSIPNGHQLIIDYSYLVLAISLFLFIVATIIHLINFFGPLTSKSKEQ